MSETNYLWAVEGRHTPDIKPRIVVRYFEKNFWYWNARHWCWRLLACFSGDCQSPEWLPFVVSEHQS